MLGMTLKFALCMFVALSLCACGGSPPVPASSSASVVTSPPDAGADTATDTDGDGVMDSRDECIREAEIYNTVEDEDGCPDTGPIVLY